MINANEAKTRSESFEHISQIILREIEDSVKFASSRGANHCFATVLGDLPDETRAKLINILSGYGYKVKQSFSGIYTVKW